MIMMREKERGREKAGEGEGERESNYLGCRHQCEEGG